MKWFKRNKRILALEEYLGLFYVEDKWGDQEYKEQKNGYGTITDILDRLVKLEEKK